MVDSHTVALQTLNDASARFDLITGRAGSYTVYFSRRAERFALCLMKLKVRDGLEAGSGRTD